MLNARVLRTTVVVAVASLLSLPTMAAEPTQAPRSLTQEDAFIYAFPHISRVGFGQIGDEARDTVTLRMRFKDKYFREYPFENGEVIYTIDGVPVSPRVGPPYDFPWNSAGTPDGTHALGAILADGPADIGLYRVVATEIVVDNEPGPVLGPQQLPVLGSSISLEPYASAAADWIEHDTGHLRVHAAPEPYPYRFVPPAHTHPDPLALLGPESWVLESLTEANSSLYDGKPILYRTLNGHLVTGTAYQQMGSDTHGAQAPVKWFTNPDGERNDNSVTPYSTYVPDPEGAGWVGVDIAGRVFRVSPAGAVTTIAGRMLDPNAVQFDPNDRRIPGSAYGSLTRLVGSFEDGLAFNAPTDLAFDPRNPKILYVADYLNHRIAKVDLSVSPPRITTHAGTPGVEGHADGAAPSALFAEPVSIAAGDDGTLYVSDQENQAIRTVSPDGATVGTLARNTDAVPLVPFAIRLDSNGDIIVAEDGTGVVQKVLADTGTVIPVSTLGGCGTKWVWLDVDRRGNVGPRDDILLVCSVGGLSHTRRISKDGLRAGFWPGGDGLLESGGLGAVSEAGGHYGWVVAIDDEEARVVYQGFGNLGLRQLRLAFDDDPDVSDYLARMHPVIQHGRQIMHSGTVPNFPFGARPSFTALRGVTGHGYLGQVPSFDVLARMSDAELAEYIQSGMGGAVARPEITGRDLDAFIYYVRINSLQGVTEPVPTPTPRPDAAAPVVDQLHVGRVGPETLEVTWQTDEPTIGVVGFGTSERYHRWSDIESGYSQLHRVLLERVPTEKSVHLSVLVRDETGNQTMTGNRVFNDSVPFAPTVAIAAEPTTVVSGQTVTVRWASTDASSCTASDGWAGAKDTSGQQGRGPLTADTTLTLTCAGDGGTVTGSVDITVLPPPPAPTIEFTATPSSVSPGSTATLNWSTENAHYCTAVNNWSGAMPTTGSAVTSPVNGTLIYSLVCGGPGGVVSKSVFITSATATPNRRRPNRRR